MALGNLAVLLATLVAPPAKALPRVGRVILIGNVYTHQRWIMANVPLFPGQQLEISTVMEAERNLRWWRVWGEATVSIQSDPLNPDNPWKTIVVNVEEGPLNWLLFGFLDSPADDAVFAVGCFAVFRCTGSQAALGWGTHLHSCFIWEGFFRLLAWSQGSAR